MPSISDIGSAFIAQRIALGLSQRELGERLSVKQPQIARWEACAYRTAALERVSAVAEALGLQTDTGVFGDVAVAAETTSPYLTTLPGSDPEARAAIERTGARPASIAAFCRLHHIERLELFGSVLRDDFGPESDVDVLVTFNADAPQQSLATLADLELELSGLFRRKTDLGTRASVMQAENYLRRRHILETARPLYVAG
jgi:predicted nucleotidyltransferase